MSLGKGYLNMFIVGAGIVTQVRLLHLEVHIFVDLDGV